MKTNGEPIESRSKFGAIVQYFQILRWLKLVCRQARLLPFKNSTGFQQKFDFLYDILYTGRRELSILIQVKRMYEKHLTHFYVK